MGRAPCCSKVGLHRGPWTPREDTLLTKYIETHGEGNWRALPKKAGLLRCGKSCRLRWMNYLRPDIKRGNISSDEDDLIIRLHVLLGNRWSLIAGRLPGRTDNEIKNYWNTHLSKKLRLQGIDPETHKLLSPGSGQAETKPKKNKNKKRKSSSTQAMIVNHNKRQRHQTATNNKSGTKDGLAAHPNEKKHIVHLPKPVRVTSFSVLPRNDSFMSTTDDHQINVGNTTDETGVMFFIGENDDHGVGGDNRMMNNDSDDHRSCFDDQYQLCSGGEQDDFLCGEHNLKKIFDEYLQVLKTTADGVDDDDQMLHMDSFAESFPV